MAVWQAQSIDVEPQVVLCNWQIVEIDFGTRHFVGYSRATREGRVSSDIVIFDRIRQADVTVSGRAYCLVGSPLRDGMFDNDAGYVFGIWMRREGVKSYEVVSGPALRGA